jgi:hypothetical protein
MRKMANFGFTFPAGSTRYPGLFGVRQCLSFPLGGSLPARNLPGARANARTMTCHCGERSSAAGFVWACVWAVLRRHRSSPRPEYRFSLNRTCFTASNKIRDHTLLPSDEQADAYLPTSDPFFPPATKITCDNQPSTLMQYGLTDSCLPPH